MCPSAQMATRLFLFKRDSIIKIQLNVLVKYKAGIIVIIIVISNYNLLEMKRPFWPWSYGSRIYG